MKQRCHAAELYPSPTGFVRDGIQWSSGAANAGVEPVSNSSICRSYRAGVSKGGGIRLADQPRARSAARQQPGGTATRRIADRAAFARRSAHSLFLPERPIDSRAGHRSRAAGRAGGLLSGSPPGQPLLVYRRGRRRAADVCEAMRRRSCGGSIRRWLGRADQRRPFVGDRHTARHQPGLRSRSWQTAPAPNISGIASSTR